MRSGVPSCIVKEKGERSIFVDRHPGGEQHSRHMIELLNLPVGARVLDMGAGAGETVAWLCEAGYNARGIDLLPRGKNVEQGDFLHCPYPDGSFDGIISQCALLVSGDTANALREVYRLLESGGVFALSDVFPADEDLEEMVRNTGFRVLQSEDMTESWKQYYFQLRWRGEISKMDCHRKFGYKLILCQKP